MGANAVDTDMGGGGGEEWERGSRGRKGWVGGGGGWGNGGAELVLRVRTEGFHGDLSG